METARRTALLRLCSSIRPSCAWIEPLSIFHLKLSIFRESACSRSRVHDGSLTEREGVVCGARVREHFGMADPVVEAVCGVVARGSTVIRWSQSVVITKSKGSCLLELHSGGSNTEDIQILDGLMPFSFWMVPFSNSFGQNVYHLFSFQMFFFYGGYLLQKHSDFEWSVLVHSCSYSRRNDFDLMLLSSLEPPLYIFTVIVSSYGMDKVKFHKKIL